MEITTIIGIVVAVIIILVGLMMVLRKPNDVTPSLESDRPRARLYRKGRQAHLRKGRLHAAHLQKLP